MDLLLNFRPIPYPPPFLTWPLRKRMLKKYLWNKWSQNLPVLNAHCGISLANPKLIWTSLFFCIPLKRCLWSIRDRGPGKKHLQILGKQHNIIWLSSFFFYCDKLWTTYNLILITYTVGSSGISHITVAVWPLLPPSSRTLRLPKLKLHTH